MSSWSVCSCSSHRNSTCSVCEDSTLAEIHKEAYLVLVASSVMRVAKKPHHKQFHQKHFFMVTDLEKMWDQLF